MIHCYPKTQYYVQTRWISFPEGGGRNYIRTPVLGKARYWAKKLKVQHRQIDVRKHGKTPYVFEGSWL